MAEGSPKLLNNEIVKKPRKKRIRACRKLTSYQNIDSETEKPDFSPSDGSNFDPNSVRDDSMELVFLSEVIFSILFQQLGI